MSALISTSDLITSEELKELFSFDEEDGEPASEEWTHSGVWKLERVDEDGSTYWRFWEIKDDA